MREYISCARRSPAAPTRSSACSGSTSRPSRVLMTYMNDVAHGTEYTLDWLLQGLTQAAKELPPDTLIEIEGCDCIGYARAMERTPDGHLRLLREAPVALSGPIVAKPEGTPP